jgi:hypothetical protein
MKTLLLALSLLAAVAQAEPTRSGSTPPALPSGDGSWCVAVALAAGAGSQWWFTETQPAPDKLHGSAYWARLLVPGLVGFGLGNFASKFTPGSLDYSAVNALAGLAGSELYLTWRF